MADIHGALLSLTEQTMGGEFITAASTGATTLALDDVSDFDEGGGFVTIAGTVYTYDSVDMDADTIHLTSGLSSGTLVADRVDIWDNDVSVVVSERRALITLDDQADGDPITADVDHSLATLLAQSTLTEGQSVTVARDGDGWRVTAVHGKNILGLQRSTSAGLYYGIDDGAGSIYGLYLSPGGGLYRLYTSADVRVKSSDNSAFMPILASAFTVSSDSSTKTDVTDTPDALAIVSAAPAKQWRYCTDAEDVRRIGPMADELPDWLAQVDPEDETLSVDLARQVGVLWAAVGQLLARIETLEKGGR